MTSIFRSIWIITNMTVGTIIEVPILLCIGFFDKRKNITGGLVRFWNNWVLWSTGIHINVQGMDNLDARQQYIFIGNHESALDIPVAVASLPFNVVFLAKKELFTIPLFGWGMSAAGMIKVDRQNRDRAKRSVGSALEALEKRNISIIMYPEGTRSYTPEMLPFKKGAFILAIRSGLPIVPITISGAREIAPKNTLRLHRGEINFIIGKPIQTTGYEESQRNELLKKVKDIIEIDRGKTHS
ncbi:MAG: 1-acyl-sn-glycerol-3-phosphate acyltransferase [Candidatus Marinimicrobia bacterium]|nr:1-acyl-sn-glycerol-3-phosphate acyltransferase [Candidatus Neomarinimicrobiota bacterium]